MLSRLPLDLFRAIIEEYLHLDVQRLARLDIAFSILQPQAAIRSPRPLGPSHDLR